MVYSFTGLLDKNKSACAWELAKNILGMYLIWKNDGWFDIDSLLPFGSAIVGVYFGISTVAATYFSNGSSSEAHRATSAST